MTGVATWSDTADLARRLEGAGFSGMLFTESSQTPWISIAMAAEAAPTLSFSTGIAEWSDAREVGRICVD